MKLPILTLFISGTILLALSGCATTPAGEQMRKANNMLRQSAKKAKQGNFAGANSDAAAIGSGVRTGVELAPVVQSKAGNKIDLKPLLAAWESGPYRDLQRAVNSGQKEMAAAAFTKLRSQCTNCHAVIGRPRIGISGAR